jgi:hypothetical protein
MQVSLCPIPGNLNVKINVVLNLHPQHSLSFHERNYNPDVETPSHGYNQNKGQRENNVRVFYQYFAA